MRTFSFILPLSYILLPFSMNAAPQLHPTMEAKIQQIAKLENSSTRVLGLLDFALEKIAECPVNIGEVYLNIAPPNSPFPSGTDPAAIQDPGRREEYQKLIDENSKRAEQLVLSKRLKSETIYILNVADDIVAREIKNRDKELFINMIESIRTVVTKL